MKIDGERIARQTPKWDNTEDEKPNKPSEKSH